LLSARELPLYREKLDTTSLLSTRELFFYRERRGSCCPIFAVNVTYLFIKRGGFLYCLLSTMELSLNRERRDPCCLLSELSWLFTHQDGSCLFIARGGDLFSFSLKGSKGVSCLSEGATPIADYVLSLLSTCDTPIPPERFYNLKKKEDKTRAVKVSVSRDNEATILLITVRFVSYSGYLQYEKKMI
jgi:hypothetical protein